MVQHMNRKFFGTDGVRGTANRAPMLPETMLRLAQAAALQFRRGAYRHRVVIGKDTRLSGYMLEPALVAGFISAGMDVVLLGPLPTPAVAMLTRSLRADLGVMISASHNPYQDNGIKLFGPDGYKLSDAVELEIEKALTTDLGAQMAAPDALGRAQRIDDARGRYIEFVKASFPRVQRLEGMKIVLDCAQGAAYRVAPAVLYELGAEVISLGITPDGTNINAGCGAMHPLALQQAVVAHGAQLGIALDGDADRLVLADEQGAIADGDAILALIAQSWQQTGQLRGGAVVATQMSNLGLERFLNSLSLKLIRTPVGDRYVVEQMRRMGCNLGGEQSGHIVCGDLATTGDGLVAALQVLAVLRDRSQSLSQALGFFKTVPQILRNVRVATPAILEEPKIVRLIAEAESALASSGRLLIRKSGTEPVLRVMAESDDAALVEEWVLRLCEALAASDTAQAGGLRAAE